MMDWKNIWLFADHPGIEMVRAESREEAVKKLHRLPQCVDPLEDFVRTLLNEEEKKEEGIECSLCNGSGIMLSGKTERGEVITTGQTCRDSEDHCQAGYAIISDVHGVRLALSLRKGTVPFLHRFFRQMRRAAREALSKQEEG